MALTTVKLVAPRISSIIPKDDFTNYIALDPAEYIDIAAAYRAVLNWRTLWDKYIDGLLTTTQKDYLYNELVAANVAIDLVLMP